MKHSLIASIITATALITNPLPAHADDSSPGFLLSALGWVGLALEAGDTGTLVCTVEKAETCTASGCKAASGEQLMGTMELKLDEKTKKLSACSSDGFLPCTTNLITSRFDGTHREIVASEQPEDTAKIRVDYLSGTFILTAGESSGQWGRASGTCQTVD